jgi:hypothetical protein
VRGGRGCTFRCEPSEQLAVFLLLSAEGSNRYQ